MVNHFSGTAQTAKNSCLTFKELKVESDTWKEGQTIVTVFSKGFKYPGGGEGQMAYWQSFAHSVNHSTYHRGQLVTLLRQSGFTGLSSIDLATYYLTLRERE